MTTCAPFCFDALYLYSEYHNELFMVSQWVRILADKQTSTNRFDFLFVFVVEAYVRIRSPFFHVSFQPSLLPSDRVENLFLAAFLFLHVVVLILAMVVFVFLTSENCVKYSSPGKVFIVFHAVCLMFANVRRKCFCTVVGRTTKFDIDISLNGPNVHFVYYVEILAISLSRMFDVVQTFR